MFVSRERPSESPAPPKAYKNEDFLNGPYARLLRIQCEFEEPRVRLEENGVDNIVMIFGSARSKTPEEYEQAVAVLREKVKTDPSVQPQLTRLDRMAFLSRYHLETIKLASLITEFSEVRAKKGLPSYVVGTGAGPGMMEAANCGAYQAGGKSVGFGISLPFETGLNPYVTPSLGFEFHYFFTRKFWMAYKCMGLVVAPGGYGTCDELFEILTLLQTDKIKRKLPVILFGEEYWSQVINFSKMEECGVIPENGRKMVFACDSAEAAFEHLKEFWLREEAAGVPSSPATKLVYRQHAQDESPDLKKLKLDSDFVPPRPLPAKAYKNSDFINSPHSRILRVQCEFDETDRRLKAHGIDNILMFSGSGMINNLEGHLSAVTAAAKDATNGARELARLSKQEPFLKYKQVVRDLARRITAWSMERHLHGKASYHVASAGGRGLMEGASEGAWEAGGKSVGFNGGRGFNNYVTPELAFDFHYFFTRKFWMAYKCMGVVALPGGVGTCDELFEILTLMQTGKIKRKMPVVLIGKEYWTSAIHWQKMADFGMISDQDVEQLLFTDSADDAFQHIVSFWTKLEDEGITAQTPRKKGLSGKPPQTPDRRLSNLIV